MDPTAYREDHGKKQQKCDSMAIVFGLAELALPLGTSVRDSLAMVDNIIAGILESIHDNGYDRIRMLDEPEVQH